MSGKWWQASRNLYIASFCTKLEGFFGERFCTKLEGFFGERFCRAQICKGGETEYPSDRLSNKIVQFVPLCT